MPEIIIEELSRLPVEQQRVELVERKGIGHPDTIELREGSPELADIFAREKIGANDTSAGNRLRAAKRDRAACARLRAIFELLRSEAPFSRKLARM